LREKTIGNRVIYEIREWGDGFLQIYSIDYLRGKKRAYGFDLGLKIWKLKIEMQILELKVSNFGTCIEIVLISVIIYMPT